MDSNKIEDVVYKLVGAIEPAGETHTDKEGTAANAHDIAQAVLTEFVKGKV